MTNPSKRVKYVCSRCGSDEVLWDAYVFWNEDEQDYEISNTFDNAVCESDECGGKECSVHEVELAEEA